MWFITWCAYLQSRFFFMTDKLVCDFFRSSLPSSRSCWHSRGKFKPCIHKRWGLVITLSLMILSAYEFCFSYYQHLFLREEFFNLFNGHFCTLFKGIFAPCLRTLAPKSSHTQIFLKLWLHVENDKIRLKPQKNRGSPNSFWR